MTGHRLHILILFIFSLSACSRKAGVGAVEESPAFVVDLASAVAVEATDLDSRTSRVLQKTYIVKACLKDGLSNQALQGLKFFLDPEVPNFTLKETDPGGCLYWPEVVPYNPTEKEHEIVLPERKIMGQGSYHGAQSISLKVDPWKKGIEAVRDARLPKMEAPFEKYTAFLTPLRLSLRPFPHSFSIDRYLDQKVTWPYQMTLNFSAFVNSQNRDDIEALTTGKFRIRGFVYSFDGSLEGAKGKDPPTLYSVFEAKAYALRGMFQANIELNLDFSELIYLSSESRIVFEISSDDENNKVDARWVAAPLLLLDRKAVMDFGADTVNAKDEEIKQRYLKNEDFKRTLNLTESPYQLFLDSSSFKEINPDDLFSNKPNAINNKYSVGPYQQNYIIFHPQSDDALWALKNLCFQFNDGEAAHECRRKPRDWIHVNSLKFIEKLVGEPRFETTPMQLSFQGYIKNEGEISNHTLEGTKDMHEYFATVGALAFLEGVIPLEGIGMRFAHDSFRIEQLEHAKLVKAGLQTNYFQRILNVENTHATFRAEVRHCAALVFLRGKYAGQSFLLCAAWGPESGSWMRPAKDRILDPRPLFVESELNEDWFFITDADYGDHSTLRNPTEAADRAWTMAIRGSTAFEALRTKLTDQAKDLLLSRSADIRFVQGSAPDFPEGVQSSRPLFVPEIFLKQGAIPGVIVR